MSSFVYETHMHTAQASACGKSRGRDYIAKYQDAGYTGIIITDHFFRGNCAISRTLPWRERVRQFCLGYEDAREEGDRRGFPVFFGWEEYFDGDEYLVYGLDQAWMLEHPEMERWTRLEQYQAVHAAGGCVVQAHPFRERGYIAAVRLSTGCVDGVEGVNAGNYPEENRLALRYAERLGLPVTAGSDNHCADTMRPDRLAGVVFDHPLTCIQDYVRAIRERQPFTLRTPPGDLAWRDDVQPPRSPVQIRGADDRPRSGDLMRFLRGGAW